MKSVLVLLSLTMAAPAAFADHYTKACGKAYSEMKKGKKVKLRNFEIENDGTLFGVKGITKIERLAFDEYFDARLGQSTREDPITFAINSEAFKNLETGKYMGYKVTIDLWEGDEDAISYYFDARAKLLFSYTHEQSPTGTWHCVGY